MKLIRFFFKILLAFSSTNLFSGFLDEWSEWSSCQLTLSGTSGFQVRNRECSGRQCSEDRQETKDCTHEQATPGWLIHRRRIYPVLRSKFQHAILELNKKELICKMFFLDQCLQATSSTTPTWGCWSEWSSCSVSCGGSGGSRSRQKVCVPGTDRIGSQDVTCSGNCGHFAILFRNTKRQTHIVFFLFLILLTFLGEDFETDSTPCNAFPCHASHCPPGYQYSSGQTCYYWGSSELTNAAGAAVVCSVKYNGRPAIFMNRDELNDVKSKILLAGN